MSTVVCVWAFASVPLYVYVSEWALMHVCVCKTDHLPKSAVKI